MAYAYCHKCEVGLPDPTFAQCIHMKMECWNCGTDYELQHSEQADVLIALEERITAIEQHLGIV